MRAGRRAFALIVVLLAVGAVFALAMRSAVVARTTVVEAQGMALRADALRDGRSAVVLTLRGLTATDAEALEEAASAAEGTGFAPAGGGSRAGDGEEEETNPELPRWLIELLGLEEVQEEAERAVDERAERFASSARAQGATGITARRTIDALGLPAEPVEVALGGRVYRVGLVDAASALDINKADERTLLAYLRALGVGEREGRRIADEWLDWVDEDDVARRFGAERGAYARDGVVPRNGPVRAVEELRLLPSMTREVFEAVRRDWTPAASGRVHAGSASYEVLASLEGSGERLARAIMEAREAGALTPEALDRMLPAIGGDALRERLTLNASGVVRTNVDVVDETSGAVQLRMEGAAVLTQGGVEWVELWVVE